MYSFCFCASVAKIAKVRVTALLEKLLHLLSESFVITTYAMKFLPVRRQAKVKLGHSHSTPLKL